MTRSFAAGPDESADLSAWITRPGGPETLAARMGIELIEASPERLVATMPVNGNKQLYGMLHGGASVVLAETLGSIGAAMHAAVATSPSGATSTPRTTGRCAAVW